MELSTHLAKAKRDFSMIFASFVFLRLRQAIAHRLHRTSKALAYFSPVRSRRESSVPRVRLAIAPAQPKRSR
jgi:hypothetical protein